MSGISSPHDGEKRLEDFWNPPPSEKEPRKIHLPEASALPKEKPPEINSTPEGGVKKSWLSKSDDKRKKNVKKRGLLTLEAYTPNPLLDSVPLCPLIGENGAQCLKPAVKERGHAKRQPKDETWLDGLPDKEPAQIQECETGHRFVEYHLADEYDEDKIESLIKAFAYEGYLTQALDTSGLKVSYFEAGQIIRYVVALLLHLEEVWEELKLPFSELLVDEQYQRVMKEMEVKAMKEGLGDKEISAKRRRLHKHQWPVIVLNEAYRYILAAVPMDNRRPRSLKKAIALALSRTKGDFKSKIMRHDGLSGYPKVVEGFGMRSFAKSKKQNFGHINLIEVRNGHFRLHGLKKSRHIPKKWLPVMLDLVRIKLNWFTSTKVLGGKTPLEAATGIKFKSIMEVVYIAELIAPLPRHAKTRKRDEPDLFSYVVASS